MVPAAIFGSIEAERRGARLLDRFDEAAAVQAGAVTALLRQTLVGKAEVVEIAAASLGAERSWDPARLQAVADPQAGPGGGFESFYVADAEGRSVAFAPARRADGSLRPQGVDYSDRDYFQAVRRTLRPAWSRVQMGRQSGVPNLMIAVPIPPAPGAPEGLRGLVVGGVQLDGLERAVRALVEQGHPQRVVVVDSFGQVLVDTAGALEPLGAAPAGALFAGGCPDGGAPVEGPDEGGVPTRAACAAFQLGDQVWVAWSGLPRAQILAGVAEARRDTWRVVLTGLGAAVLVAAGLSALLGRWARRVRDGALRVSAGDLTVRPRTPGPFAPREVAEVSRVIDHALHQLQDADARLRVANARMRPLAAAWDQMSDAVETLEPDGRVRSVNPAWRRLFGPDAPDPIGRRSRLLGEDDLPAGQRADALFAGLQHGEGWHGEVRSRTASGPRAQGVAATPVLGEDGRLQLVFVSRRDLTELREAQAAAQAQERLAAVGTLAAGVAHEINNPLTFVRANLELIADASDDPDLSTPEERATLARDALAGVDRVTRIVRDLLVVARGAAGVVQEPARVLELAPLARAAASLAGPKVTGLAQLRLRVPPGLRAEVREGEIVQVMLNLLLNAAQAPRAAAGMGVVELRGGAGSDGEVWLEVVDDGLGVPEPLQARVFEPFFTTRAVGEGTGLGLSVSRGIAQAHGGRLELLPGPLPGARFRLTLPASAAPPAPSPSPALPSSAPAPAPAPRGPALAPRVLVVDDDPPVARSLARLLRAHGAVVAHSGAEALELLERLPIEVVVSDVRMPGMTGPELHRAVRADRALPFIFVTGAAGDVEVRALEASGCPVLPKPVDPRALTGLVGELLHAEAVP